MDIYILQDNYRNKFLVVIDDNVYVYKHRKCNFDPPFPSFQAKFIFVGKSRVCEMTEFSEAEDKVEFDGNTLLLQCENNEYVYISGLEFFKFKTDDKIIDYISLMGNNMTPYTFAVGEKFTSSLSSNYKFIENDKIEEGILLNATNNSLDPYDYHVEKCVIDALKKLENELIHTSWPGHRDGDGRVEDDSDVEDVVEGNEDLIETIYANGTNEVVKIFIQKCVICLERNSDYAFTQCGHQCLFEQCYQNKGDIDLLKCVVFRT